MIFYYLDASAWVKRYCQETGSSWVEESATPENEEKERDSPAEA